MRFFLSRYSLCWCSLMTVCADSSQLLWLCPGSHSPASTDHTNSNSKLILPEKSSYNHMANSLRGQDKLNPALWLATPAGKMPFYYMANSVSRQDELNLALWLATRAGKMELSCPLGIRALSRKEHLSCYGVLSHIINPLLTKLVRSKWLDIGLVLFLRVYGPRQSRGP